MQSDYGGPPYRTRGEFGRGRGGFSRGGFGEDSGYGRETTAHGDSEFGASARGRGSFGGERNDTEPAIRGFGRGGFGISGPGRGGFMNDNNETPASGFGGRGRGGDISDAPTRGFSGRGRGFSAAEEPVHAFGGHGGDADIAPTRGFAGRGRGFDAEEKSSRGLGADVSEAPARGFAVREEPARGFVGDNPPTRGFGSRGRGFDSEEAPTYGFGGRGRGADVSEAPTRGFSGRGRGFDSDDFPARGRGLESQAVPTRGFGGRGRGFDSDDVSVRGFSGRGRGTDVPEAPTRGFSGRGRGFDSDDVPASGFSGRGRGRGTGSDDFPTRGRGLESQAVPTGGFVGRGRGGDVSEAPTRGYSSRGRGFDSDDVPTRGFSERGRGFDGGEESSRGYSGRGRGDNDEGGSFRGRGGFRGDNDESDGGGFRGRGRGGFGGDNDEGGFRGRGRGGFRGGNDDGDGGGFRGRGGFRGGNDDGDGGGFRGRGGFRGGNDDGDGGGGFRGRGFGGDNDEGGFRGRGRGGFRGDNDEGGFRGRGGFRGGNDDGDSGGFRGRGRGGYGGDNDDGGFRGRGRGGFRGGNDDGESGGFRGRGRGGFQDDNGEGGFRGRGRGGFGESRGDFGNRRHFDDAGEGADGFQSSRPAFGGEAEVDPAKPVDPNEVVNEETPRGYAPTKRNVDALFKEDADNANDYAGVCDADDDITVENLTEHVLSSVERWDEMELNANLLKNVKEKSMYLRPRKIQSFVIPFIIDGYDVKGQAETGSGKTAAFVIPVIQRILEVKKDGVESDMLCPFCVVVCPTRELVLQVYEQAYKFSDGLDVSVAKSYGQYSMGVNVREMQAGCDIFVTTPGRLKHFATEGTLRLKQMIFFILDEADRMMGDSFMNDIDEVMSLTGFPAPEKHQTLLFSATFDDEVENVCKRLLRPGYVFVTNKRNNPNKRIVQSFVVTDPQDKLNKCLEILKADPDKKTLVFVSRKSTADILACFLCRNEVTTTSIHGDRGQHQRERALTDFRNGFCKVLVATDVAARGLDISGLDHVINYDMPNEGITYVHRIGRTGRIRQGKATSIVTTHDSSLLSNISDELRNSGTPVPDSLTEAIEKLGGGGFSYSGNNFGSQMAASGGNAAALPELEIDDW